MRKLFVLMAAGFLAIGVAGQAQAVSLGFTGALSLSFGFGDPVVLPGAGTAIVNGSGAGGHLTGLALAGGTFATASLVLPVTDPAATGNGVHGVQVTGSNASASFVGSGGAGFGGDMPMNGVSKVCLLGSACSNAGFNISVPLSVVGQAGAVYVTAALNLTVVGAPWTTGTAAVGTITQMGGVSPLSNTGAPSGIVNLVTPIFISTNIGAAAVLPGFAFLTLHFVPEPGTLVLLGSGIAGLVMFGRSRRS